MGAVAAVWPLMLGGLFLVIKSLHPFGAYYDTGELLVYPDPAVQGDIRLEYNGRTLREFKGKYSVIVRGFKDNVIACDASSAVFTYRTDSVRPEVLTMEWWAPGDPRCANLPAGTYEMETCWTIVDLGPWGFLPNETECVTTPAFRVS